MPANRRRGGFGGSLLRVPQALPDDDEPTPEPQRTEPDGEDRAEPVVEEPAAEPAAEPELQSEETGSVVAIEEKRPGPRPARAAAPEPSPPVEEQRGSRKPPATIRLNDRAGEALWQAYLEAKTADPFLSYRQFASLVVLDGLAADKKRRSR